MLVVNDITSENWKKIKITSGYALWWLWTSNKKNHSDFWNQNKNQKFILFSWKKPDLESGSQFYFGVKPEMIFLKKKKGLKSGVDQKLTNSQLPIKLEFMFRTTGDQNQILGSIFVRNPNVDSSNFKNQNQVK
jgi:hypothetical protein